MKVKERKVMKVENKPGPDQPRRQNWTPPTLKYVGHVGDVLQGGGGKLSTSPSDPGESRKPPGQM
jgi:hypothetical protein